MATQRSKAVEFSEKFGLVPGKVSHQRLTQKFVTYRVDTNIVGFSAKEGDKNHVENMIVNYFEARNWTITIIEKKPDDDLMIEAVGHGVEATVIVANFDAYCMSDWDNDVNHPDFLAVAFFDPAPEQFKEKLK